MLELMYITNNIKVAKIAQEAGVDRIWVDLEYKGKEERQAGMNTVKSNHTIEDIKKLRPIVNKSKLMVRINPIDDESEKEINEVIAAGADIIMLPMFKTKEEVETFIKIVDGRVKTILLFETAESVKNVDEILDIHGIDEVHIGLNDLHLAYKKSFMFELLTDGTVEHLCKKFKDKGLPYGFGGIARIGYGLLPAEKIITEHYRLGSTRAILSRSFCNANVTKNMGVVRKLFSLEILKIRDYEKKIERCSVENFEKNWRDVKYLVSMISKQETDIKKVKICAISTISKTMDCFIVDTMRNLSKNGYDITLISNMESEFINKNCDFAKCINLPMTRGVSIVNLIKTIRSLKRIFKKEKFDVIYYTTPNASMYAAIAGKATGIKVRIYNQCGLRYVSFTGIKRKIFKWIEKLTCKKSTHVRSQSPMNMQFAIDEGLCKKDKISVVGIGGTTGVDLKECDSFDHVEAKQTLRLKYGIPQDAFVYGYVGRINKDKGINELIEAFCKISEKYKAVYLVMVGMKDDTNPITQQNMQTAEENKRIIMTGNVPKNEVYPHMSVFDVLVHPTYREGFGKVLQEAMGMNLPIITTNVPGPSEVVEQGACGLLVEVQNIEDLAQKMLDIHSDSKLRSTLSQKGRERAEKYFDRPIMLNNILEDMNQIMGETE